MSTSLIIVALVGIYAIFLILLKLMGTTINNNLGSGIFATLSAVIPLGYYVYEKFVHHGGDVPTTTLGIVYAVVAGVIIAIYNILFILLFSRGVNASYIFPIVYGAGAIAIPSLVGWVFFREHISLLQGSGIVLILLGIALVVIAKM